MSLVKTPADAASAIDVRSPGRTATLTRFSLRDKSLLAIRALSFALAVAITGTPGVASSSDCGDSATLAQLIADPDAYQGRTLWVVAYATIDFENMTVCPSEDDVQMKQCLWLAIDDGPFSSDADYARYQSKLQAWEAFNLQMVAVRAVFDKDMTGHFGMWPAGLKGVTEVHAHQGGWSFVSGAALPRTRCVAALPAAQESVARLFRIGDLKLRNDKVDAAIVDFSRAIELDPKLSGLYLARGNAKKRKHDYHGAIADFTRAIDLEPEHKDVMFVARAGARERIGDLKGAIADYSAAIALDPGHKNNYYLRGLAKKRNGDAEGAKAYIAPA